MLSDSVQSATFPPDPVVVIDPVSQSLINIRPMLLLIYQDYQGDKDRLVDQLHELTSYLQTVQTTDDSAQRLRRMLGIVSGLAAAVDSIRVMPQPFMY